MKYTSFENHDISLYTSVMPQPIDLDRLAQTLTLLKASQLEQLELAFAAAEETEIATRRAEIRDLEDQKKTVFLDDLSEEFS